MKVINRFKKQLGTAWKKRLPGPLKFKAEIQPAAHEIPRVEAAGI